MALPIYRQSPELIEPDPKDDNLMEIKALVDKINMLTNLVREIDAMPIVAKINKNPF